MKDSSIIQSNQGRSEVRTLERSCSSSDINPSRKYTIWKAVLLRTKSKTRQRVNESAKLEFSSEPNASSIFSCFCPGSRITTTKFKMASFASKASDGPIDSEMHPTDEWIQTINISYFSPSVQKSNKNLILNVPIMVLECPSCCKKRGGQLARPEASQLLVHLNRSWVKYS